MRGNHEGEHDVVTDRLLRLYRRYLGEPERLSDVYLGFALFFAGVAFAVVGLVTFLWSTVVPEGFGTYWQLRETAISLSMLGLPAFLLGVVVLLPVDRRAVYSSSLGGAVSLLAVGVFVANYPGNWNASGPDASATGVTIYAVGLVLSTAAVGAALVSNYLHRADPAASADASADGATSADGSKAARAPGAASAETESVTDEQVRADIDEAMSAADLSWGGVEKGNTKRLKLETDVGDVDRSNFDETGANENRAAGNDVDDAVTGLQQLRGGAAEQATGEGTDDQADALNQLREQQAHEEAESDDGLVGRLRNHIDL